MSLGDSSGPDQEEAQVQYLSTALESPGENLLFRSQPLKSPIFSGGQKREHLQETIDFTMKYVIFLYFSLKPIN